MAVVTVLLVAAICVPQAGGRFFGAVESFGSRVARRKALAIVWVTAAGIFLRVAMLPQIPVPIPEFHDEFSYLLAADTFAHGRLTYPPHPMRIYFDTMHVNQLPTYMSKYPPAQGAALALGQVLGHPWIGVLLSVAAMVAAVVWALQGWLPPSWALLGGVLLVLRVGIFGYWINSYWGGAVAALGGALVIGALPRIMRARRPRDAVILGLGVAILANSRPFEGLIFSAPVVAVLLFWLFRKHSPSWRQTLPRVVAPFCVVILSCGAFMAYYNWRGTGNLVLFPYTANERVYESSAPALLWQKATAPVHYANAQFDAFYNGVNHDTWQQGRADSIGKAIRLLVRDAGRFVRFLLWPELCVPFLLLPWIVRDRRVRFLVAQTAICFCGFVLVAWFFPALRGAAGRDGLCAHDAGISPSPEGNLARPACRRWCFARGGDCRSPPRALSHDGLPEGRRGQTGAHREGIGKDAGQATRDRALFSETRCECGMGLQPRGYRRFKGRVGAGHTGRRPCSAAGLLP